MPLKTRPQTHLYLLVQEGSLAQATYRIRILPWMRIDSNWVKTYRWHRLCSLIYRALTLRLANLDTKIVVLLNKSYQLRHTSVLMVLRCLGAHVIRDIADYNRNHDKPGLFLSSSLYLQKLAILSSDTLTVPTPELQRSLRLVAKRKNIIVIPDAVDFQHVPDFCRVPSGNTMSLTLGWYGTSGKRHPITGHLLASDSFSSLLNCLPHLNKNHTISDLKLILLTDNIELVKGYACIIQAIDEGWLQVWKYEIAYLGAFFDLTDIILLTYGDTPINNGKSTNRVDLSLWLGKPTVLFQPPQSWIDRGEPCLNATSIVNSLDQIEEQICMSATSFDMHHHLEHRKNSLDSIVNNIAEVNSIRLLTLEKLLRS